MLAAITIDRTLCYLLVVISVISSGKRSVYCDHAYIKLQAHVGRISLATTAQLQTRWSWVRDGGWRGYGAVHPRRNL